MSDHRNDSGFDPQVVRLRIVAAVVTIALLIFLVIVDTFGRLFIDREFRVSETIFLVLAGVLLAVLGLEGAARLMRK